MVAEGITDRFVPAPRTSVESFAVGQELVLVDTDSGMIHALNPVAALVWQCFDGKAQLSEIVPDLAEAFATPAGVVHDDVLQMTCDVARAGLLEGVEGEGSSVSSDRGGLDIGDVVAIGGAVGSAGGATQTWILINWSSACGFCRQILPHLASLQPTLAKAEVTLVLLDQSDPTATRQLLDETGLVARVAPYQAALADGSDPFDGLGTPAAYLVGPDDRIVSPLAYGADSVLSLVGSAVAGYGDGDGAEIPEFLPVGSGACGPGSSRTAEPVRPAAAYQVGRYRIGIRANTLWAEEMVAEALTDYRLDPPAAAPDDFTVTLSARGRGRRDLNVLLAGGQVVARSRSPRRLMAALAGHLSCLLDSPPGLTRIDAVAAVIGDLAVLLPKPVFTSHLEKIQAPLARLGVRVSDEPFAHVDMASMELVVPDTRIGMRQGTLARLDDPAPTRSEPDPVAPGRYALRAWFLTSSKPNITPSGAVAAALGSLVAGTSEVGSHVGVLISLLEAIDVVPVLAGDPRSVAELLAKWGADRAGHVSGQDFRLTPWRSL